MSSQSLEALAMANDFRLRRAALKRRLKDRELTLREVLDAEIPDWLLNMPVGQLLIAPKSIKRVVVLRALRQAHVSEIRPIGQIPLRQRRALLFLLEQHSPMLRRVS